jgi:O-antigen ligase
MMAVTIALCYLILHFNRKAVFGLFGALGFFGVFAGKRFLSTFALSGHSVRIQIWVTSLKIIKDNLLFGVGPGNFGKVFDVYRSVSSTKEVTCAHSNYLNIFVGWGIIGGLLFWGWQLFIMVRVGIRGLAPMQRVVIAILIGFYAHVMINELFTAYAGFLLGLLDHSSFDKELEKLKVTTVS